MDRWEISPFLFKSLPQNEIRGQWTRWRRNFDYIVAASGETNKTKLKYLLLARAGPDVQDIFQAIPDADVLEDAEKKIDPFKVALDKLDEYFAPKHHESMERNIFWTLNPEPNENLEKFMLRAREQAYKCNFGATLQESRDICVIDKIIMLAPSDLKEKLLQKESLKLDDVFKIVSSHQSIKYQASHMTAPGRSGIITPSSSSPGPSEVNRLQLNPNRDIECGRCGRKGHYSNDPKCPAWGEVCDLCKREGHFAIKCKTGRAKALFRNPSSAKKQKRFQPPTHRVRNISEEQAEDKPMEEQPQSFIFAIGDGDEFIWIKIGGIMVQVLIDSGSNKNIIDDGTWGRLKAQGVIIRNQTTMVDHQFRGYGKQAEAMKVLGMFDATIEIEDDNRTINGEARFYVIENGSQALLGKETAKELNLLRLGLPKKEAEILQVRVFSSL